MRKEIITWEQRKLADVVGATYGGGTPATANEAFWNGDIPWIQSSNTIEGQLFDVDVKKHISRDGLTHSATQIIPANSVAVVTHVGVGKLVFMPYSYTTSQDFISLSNLKCSPQFLCYALYRKLQEDLHIVQGSAIKGITKEDLMIKQLAMPEIEEQEQIANTLETLDHLITLHQRELDSYKKFKNGMLQKMFPKNGETVPEIRFPGFSDPWEQRKLGDVFVEYSEKNHEELPALMIIQGGGTIRRDESDRSLLYDKANLSNYKMVKEGDFIVHLRSFEGGLEKATNTGIISPAYHAFHGENTDSRFYYSYFRSKKFIDIDLKPHVYGIRDGRSIDIEGMKTIKIPSTGYEEQKAIGTFIEHLDNLITLHQREEKLLKIL